MFVRGPSVTGPRNVTAWLKVVFALNTGTDAAANVVGALKVAFPVKVRSCPVKELVKNVIVILDVVAFSSLMMSTSLGEMAVTAGSSLTLILAMF